VNRNGGHDLMHSYHLEIRCRIVCTDVYQSWTGSTSLGSIKRNY